MQIESDLYQHGLDYAYAEVVRKYPGAITHVEMVKSLVNSYVNSKRKKGTKNAE